MNLDNRNSGKELLDFLMSEVGSARVAPTNLSSADIHACRLLLQRDLERAKKEAFRRGFRKGVKKERATRLEAKTAPPYSHFSPLEKTGEGIKALLSNIGSTLLVSWTLQFFIPFLGDWSTALVVVEIVRGAIKVGGDFAFNECYTRSPKERVPLRAQLQFSVMYAAALAAQAVGTSILTQVLSNLILQFTRELPLQIAISWFDVSAAGALAFFSGFVAIYTQGFCIVPWVRNNFAEHKHAFWLTTTRSYVRMLTNYLGLFSLAALLNRLAHSFPTIFGA